LITMAAMSSAPAPAPAPVSAPASGAIEVKVDPTTGALVGPGGAPAPAPDPRARFDALAKQKEFPAAIADKLYSQLSNCVVHLVCDDSGSMGSAITEPGVGGAPGKQTTRWLELKRLAAEIINIVTSLNPYGIDIHFFHRDSLKNVTSPAGLQAVFAAPPSGGTPIVTTVERVVNEARPTLGSRNLLVLAITDGEPSGGPRETRDGLRSMLTSVTASGNVHISFAECTDNSDDMEWLDEFDGVIKNFDNTDDYREELARVRQTQGTTFKFDYSDYVCKILLATFDRWYYNLDQRKVGGTTTPASGGNPQGCCTIL